MRPPRRFRDLPVWRGHCLVVPIAATFRSRTLGLAWLDRSRAGSGLLLPRCRSVHTFGVRFELDLVFLDSRGACLKVCRAVRPQRFIGCRRAVTVLEIVPEAGEGGRETEPRGYRRHAPGTNRDRQSGGL